MKKIKYLIIVLSFLFFLINNSIIAEEGKSDYLVLYNNIDVKAYTLEYSSIEGSSSEVYSNLGIEKLTLSFNEMEKLENDSNVIAVIPDIIVNVYEDEITWSDSMLKAPDAWKSNYTGKGVNVAVLDTGISEHIDLNITGRYDAVADSGNAADNYGHGTAVAGIIGAKDNGTGIVGIAPDANIYAVKVMDTKDGKLSNLIKGIDWCISNDIDIANMSLGINPNAYSETENKDILLLLNELTTRAFNSGVILVAASGNDGNYSDNVSYPARLNNVIAVGAIDINKSLAIFSSVGPSIDVVAPGVSVKTLGLNNSYVLGNGTSFAAPNIAGLVALYKEQYPNFNNSEIVAKIISNTEDLGSIGFDNYYGNGLPVYKSSFSTQYNFYEPVGGKYSIDSSYSNLRLDGGSVTGKVVQNTGTDSQIWNIEKQSDGNYKIIWGDTGKVLTLINGAVTLADWNGSNTQKWVFWKSPEGKVKIVSVGNGYPVLDLQSESMNTGIELVGASGSYKLSQEFKLNPIALVSTQYNFYEPVGGKYSIDSSYSNLRLDGGNVTGKVVQNTGTDSQIWNIEKQSDGNYKIIWGDTGKVLTLINGAVTLADWNGSNTQKWVFWKSPEGKVKIVSVGNGYPVLDLQSESMNTGIELVGVSGSYKLSQEFKLNPIALVSTQYNFYEPVGGKYSIDSSYSNLRLDGGSVTGKVVQNTGTDSQIWNIEKQSDGNYKIIWGDTGKVLTLINGAVTLADWNGSNTQKWVFWKSPEGKVKIVSVGNGYPVLDLQSESMNTGIELVGVSGSYKLSQEFKLNPIALVSTQYNFYEPVGGKYSIDSSYSNLRLDGGSVTGKVVQNTGTDSQIWNIEKQSDGNYKIIWGDTGKVLTLINGVVSLRDWNGSNTQKWVFWKSPEGKVKIVSVGNGYPVLDLQRPSMNTGIELVGVSGSYKLSQEFVFIKRN